MAYIKEIERSFYIIRKDALSFFVYICYNNADYKECNNKIEYSRSCLERHDFNMTIESFKSEDTYQFGLQLGSNAKPGEIYCLSGDLGVGKTVFTQGFARGLGILEAVNSPTFTIVQEYEGEKLPFYHFDVYRISDIDEMEEIGYEDYFYGEGVCLIEWAEIIEDLLPQKHTNVSIQKQLEKGFDYRIIIVEEQ